MNSSPVAPISAEKIRMIIEEFKIDCSFALSERFRIYIELLLRWNRKISLTSIESPEEITRVHFAESLFAAKLPLNQHGRLADVGTGAGFPGLPLKLYFPDLEVTLIESNAKKCAFLGEVVRATELSGVNIVNKRFEELVSGRPGFDLITARALGKFGPFSKWAAAAAAPNGQIVIWTGPEGFEELRGESKWEWQKFEIPATQQRFIVVGSSPT